MTGITKNDGKAYTDTAQLQLQNLKSGTIARLITSERFAISTVDAGGGLTLPNGNFANLLAFLGTKWVIKVSPFTIDAETEFLTDASGGVINAEFKSSYVVGEEIIVNNDPESTNTVTLTNTSLTIVGPSGTVPAGTDIILKPGELFNAIAKTTTKLVRIADVVNMDNVNVSEMENPLTHLLAKNDLVRVIDGKTVLTSIRNTIATFIDINGVFRTAAIDDPREEETGWLFEGGITTELVENITFDNIAWAKVESSVTPDAAIAPDGTMTADKLIPSTNNAQHDIRDIVTTITATDYTMPLFIKSPGEGISVKLLSVNGSSISVNATNGNIISSSGIKATVRPSVNGWFRIDVYDIEDVGAGVVFRIQAILDDGTTTFAGDGVSGVYIWLAGLQRLPFASSGIISGASPVSRSADNISIPAQGNFRESKGMIFVKSDVIGDTGADQYIFEASDGTDNNRHALIRSNDKIRLLIVDGGLTQVDISTTFDMDPFEQFEISYNYETNDVELFVDGFSIGTETSCTMPTGLTIVNLGKTNSAGNEQYGHNQDFRSNQKPRNIDEIRYLGDK